MTTELEKQFFDTFGIEPKKVTIWNALPCYMSEEYPQITDRHYLELICIVNERRILPNLDVDGLKEYILKELSTMIISEKIKHQVQAIFEGE